MSTKPTAPPSQPIAGCNNCKFAQLSRATGSYESTSVTCRRYPEFTIRISGDWCGEYVSGTPSQAGKQ